VFGEADERLDRAGHRRQRPLHGRARIFDAAAQFLFLARLQQLALAHIAQINPNEIELLPRYAGLDRLGFAAIAMRILAVGVGDRLIVEGFGVLLAEQPLGRLAAVRAGLVAVVSRAESELVRPPPPVEDIGVARRLAPVDERGLISRGGRPRRSGSSFAGHGRKHSNSAAASIRAVKPGLIRESKYLT